MTSIYLGDDMAIRDEIRQTLAEMRLDNSPTQDYQNKVEFTQKGGVWRRHTVAERLYRQEKIGQDVFDACDRWLTTYILAYDGAGAVQSGASTSIIKHDLISWRLHMAKEVACIPEIKSRIGVSNHNILVLALYEGYCITELSKIFAPKRDPKNMRLLVVTACIEAFNALLSAYKELSKK